MKINKLIKSKKVHKWLYPTLLFIAAVTVITYMYQFQNSHNYKYQLNRPWQYNELKAQFDFNIYKSQSEIDAKRDSTINNAIYYYNFDRNKVEEAKKFINQMNRSNTTKNTLEETITNLYDRGIISNENYLSLQSKDVSTISVRIYNSSNVNAESSEQSNNYNNNERRLIKDLITLEDARAELNNITTPTKIKIILSPSTIDSLITPNLEYDSIFTNKSLDSYLANIDSVKQKITKGETLVNRGERITPETMKKLQAYEAAGADFFANDKSTIISSIVGQAMTFGSLIGFLYMFLFFFRNRIWKNNRAISLIILLMTIVTATAFLLSNYGNHLIYMTPFVIIPIITVTFFDSRTALYAHIITVLICSFAVMEPLFFIYSQIIAGMASINSLKDMSKRSQLFRCAALTFGVYLFAYISYTLIVEGSITKLNAPIMVALLVSCLVLLFAYLLIYIFERTFGFLSSVTLVELSDINSPLLLRLSEEAPGTFQHSMQVSNLAAAAAIKVGANAQLVRTGALYHDIGKLANPVYFTENQAGANPHNALTAIESAKIIISHVKDGMDMAQKYGLPLQVQEFIATHHGHGMAKYFYTTYCNEHPDEKVDKSLFTYPGHNPQIKETGILMMADSVEAASRSLKEYNETSIRRLVNGIIDSQMADGLLRNTPLSFQDVEIIKDVFVEKLVTINHSRIAYPTLNKKNEKPAQEAPAEKKAATPAAPAEKKTVAPTEKKAATPAAPAEKKTVAPAAPAETYRMLSTTPTNQSQSALGTQQPSEQAEKPSTTATPPATPPTHKEK